MNAKNISPERTARIEALGYDYAAQPKEQRHGCNLCGGEVLVTITHSDRYGMPAKAQGCRACGLVFLNPVMTPVAYGQFYVNVYRPLVSAYHGRRIDAETLQDEQRLYAIDLAALLDRHCAGRGYRTLLDVGGSTGVVAHHLYQRLGLKGTIVDPAPLETEVAERLGLETVTGMVEDYNPGDKQFDVVIVAQTVDHLLNISATLHKLRSLVADGGLLFIDIVDFRAAYLRNASVEQAVKIDHPFYLTEVTMEAYLARSGFEPVEVNYAPDHLHIGFVCRLADPRPESMPTRAGVERFFREIRETQNHF